MRARLRFWLAMLDVAHAVRSRTGRIGRRVVRPVYLWIVGRASDATDWE